MEEDVRRELDLLHQADRDLRQMVTDLDNHGSRGVLQLTGQVTELIKDVSEVKIAFQNHEQQHERDKESVRKNRRWYVGTVIAALVCLATIVGLLVDIRRSVR